MSKLTQRIKTHRFTTLAFSMVLLGVLAGVVVGWSGKASSYFKPFQAVEPKITTKTPALRILSTQRTNLGNNSIMVVKLQNISGKKIKAYTIASGKAWVTKQYFFEEESIGPNAIETQFIPLSSDAPQDYKVTFEGGKEFTIAAVFFDDGTGEGDPLFVYRLKDEHAGIRDQANRILPCLQGLSSALAHGESAIAACEAEALRLPITGSGRSSDYESGLVNAQREVLSQLKDIRERVRSNNLSEALNKKDKVTRVFLELAQ